MEKTTIPPLNIPETDNKLAITVLKALYEAAIRLNLPLEEYWASGSDKSKPAS